MGCKNILLVEDDAGIRESLRLALECEGYGVFTASNGQEGLDIFPTLPSLCVVLLDYMMPVMDGPEFLEARKRHDGLLRVPVIMVSAYPERARQLKTDGFVRKPVDLDELLGVIGTHCG